MVLSYGSSTILSHSIELRGFQRGARCCKTYVWKIPCIMDHSYRTYNNESTVKKTEIATRRKRCPFMSNQTDNTCSHWWFMLDGLEGRSSSWPFRCTMRRLQLDRTVLTAWYLSVPSPKRLVWTTFAPFPFCGKLNQPSQRKSTVFWKCTFQTFSK